MLYLQEIMPVNLCDQRVCRLHFTYSRTFIHVYTQNTQSIHCTHWVLAQHVYALLAGHKEYKWPIRNILSWVCMNSLLKICVQNRKLLSQQVFHLWLDHAEWIICPSSKMSFRYWLPLVDKVSFLFRIYGQEDKRYINHQCCLTISNTLQIGSSLDSNLWSLAPKFLSYYYQAEPVSLPY